jgi:hypothetical protein
MSTGTTSDQPRLTISKVNFSDWVQNPHGAHHVSRSPQADCCRAKSEMGEAEGRFHSTGCQTQAPHLGGRSGANQSGGTGTMGEGQGSNELSAVRLAESHTVTDHVTNFSGRFFLHSTPRNTTGIP